MAPRRYGESQGGCGHTVYAQSIWGLHSEALVWAMVIPGGLSWECCMEMLRNITNEHSLVLFSSSQPVTLQPVTSKDFRHR